MTWNDIKSYFGVEYENERQELLQELLRKNLTAPAEGDEEEKKEIKRLWIIAKVAKTLKITKSAIYQWDPHAIPELKQFKLEKITNGVLKVTSVI